MTWMRWRVDGPTKLRARKKSGKSKKSPLAAFAAPGRRKRRPHILEMYSKLYYKERIKPALQAELDTTKPTEEETTGQFNTRRLRTMHVVRQRLWDNETEDVKKEVTDTLERDYPKAKAKQDKDKEDKDAGDDDTGKLTPAAAQEYVLPLLLFSPIY